MEIIICCIDGEFYEQLQAAFPDGNKYNIKAYHGDFRTLEMSYDCIVSPGNSHGIMDGGIDMPIARMFGHYAEFIERVQTHLKKECNFKQIPGSATLIPTGDARCRYLIHTPTMLVPLPIQDKTVVYWCFYNLLQSASTAPDIKRICMSGLGTGAGRVRGCEFIKLVTLAYDHFIENSLRTSIAWSVANKQFVELEKMVRSFPPSEIDLHQMIRYKQLMLTY